MSTKYGLFIILFIYSLTLVKSNDILMGYASPYAKKIYSAIKVADPAFWRRTDDIMVSAPFHDIISAIYITDLRPDKEGEAYIEAGGLGSRTVTIALKSPSILRGYKFSVEVYARSIYQHPSYYHNGYTMSRIYNGAPLSGVGGGQYPSYPGNYPGSISGGYSGSYSGNYPMTNSGYALG